MKKLFILLVIVIVSGTITFVPFSKAQSAEQVLLDVPFMNQGTTNWCWANSIAMVMQYYGKTVHSWDLAEAVNRGHDEGANIVDILLPVKSYIENSGLTLDSWEVLSSTAFGSSWETFKSHLDAGEPMVFCGAALVWDWPPVKGHAIVVTGYQDDASGKFLYVHDPSGYFVNTLWDLGVSSLIHVKVPFQKFLLGWGTWWLSFSVVVVHGIPNPPQGSMYLRDGAISHYNFLDGGNDGDLYLNNELSWTKETGSGTGGGEEVLLTEDILIYPHVANQYSIEKSYQLNIELLNPATGERIPFPNSIKKGDVGPRSTQLFPVFIRSATLSTLQPGTYHLYLALWKRDPDYSVDEPFDRIGPLKITIASQYASKNLDVFHDAEVAPGGGVRGIMWTVDIKASVRAYLHITVGGWYWSLYADAYMTRTGDEYQDTGQTPLEFEVNAYDPYGSEIYTGSWSPTDTDGDGIYGDYSNLGGATPRVQSPVYPLSSIPEYIVIKTRWRVYDEYWWPVQNLWIESTEMETARLYRTRSGGPDHFGYTFIDCKAPGGPAYDWVEISGTGTEILSSSDDSWVTDINLGFFFNYYGTDYSQLAIGNNGLLFSGVGTRQYINDPITQSPRIHGFIAPYWDDIVTWGSAGAVYYQTLGTAPNRKFIVEWHNNGHYHDSSEWITFEAILYEGTNNILFQYKDVSFGSVYGAVSGDNPPYDNGGSATVGIENPTGNIGLQYSFNEQVITPGLTILFKFPAFAGTNMYLSMSAPESKDRGSSMTYTLYYNDFGDQTASNVVLQHTLSSNVDFGSASDGGTYDSGTGIVTWNIGSVPAFPSGRGSRTVTVTIPNSVLIGTVIQTTASISTSTLETRYDDNTASTQTTVTGSNLPPNVGVGPTLGNTGGIPSVYWRTPITFTYYDPTATSVDIRIHFDSGGSDITGSMTGGPPTWTFTVTFYPRHGRVTVTYTVNDPTPYLANFDLRNMRGFENTITATEIENHIQSVTPDSPMLTEAGLGQRFIDAGRSNDVNPAFLVATAQHEGVYGTQGWSAAHPDAHNTMGWGIYPGHMDEDWEGLDRNAFASWGDCIAHVAWRISAPDGPYYGAGHYTVNEIRTIYAGEPAIQTIVNYMNDLARSAGQAGVFDENFNIYIDPAGYIFDVNTGERISSAAVWLQRPDGLGGWESVPTGQSPPIMQPDVNPQVTGADGQYQWDVLEGSYRVHVEAPGYYPAESIVVNIPPPVTDLHIGLTPLPPPPDPVPPTTILSIGNPEHIDPSGNVYVTQHTPFTLTAEDNPGGTGVASTVYRINPPHDNGWLGYSIPFYLTDLPDGSYDIEYNSTDNVGNVESTNTQAVILDNTAPEIIVSTPPAGWALQDGVTFLGSITDAGCGVFFMSFSIREANGGDGIPIGFEDLPASFNPSTGDWSFSFETLLVPDGYYVLYIEAEDNLGNEASNTVPYSIRNWAVIELLPSSEDNKAGRTMPVKFALRVAAEVDPNQPFVYNEKLRIEIYATNNPAKILQESYFGDTSRDYRISSVQYVTNFKTIKKQPIEYTVAIYRDTFDVGSFTFRTTK